MKRDEHLHEYHVNSILQTTDEIDGYSMQPNMAQINIFS